MLARFSATTTALLSVGLLPVLRPPIPSSKVSLFPPFVRCRFKRTFRSISIDNGAPVVVVEDGKYGRKQVISLTPQLYEYVLSNVREPQILRELREETSTMHGSQMQVSPDQAQLLAMLVQIMGAKKCIEVGIYTV